MATTADPLADPIARVFCDIVARVPVGEIETALNLTGLKPLPFHVESVLKLSYSHPASAVKFFRWSGLSTKHSHYSWNIMVDILGKNALFEPMWDAIRSMKQESALTVATFASAFGSYCSAGKFKEAIMTFDVMDRYGLPKDALAVNSLLSAICCHEGRMAEAAEFFDRIKAKIAPDADTFAILLEGWEKEGNLARAKTTFGEMVIRIGWNEDNMSAYDAFLTTLVRGGQPGEAINFLKVMKAKNCLPGIKFFANALDLLVQKGDALHAIALWDLMVTGSGLLPNLVMYTAIIALVCNAGSPDLAYRFLDEMPFHGVFPDSHTYNTIFECFIKNNKAREAGRLLREMRKNEKLPSPSNCVAAVRMFFDEFDPAAALEVWQCVAEERIRPDEDCANELLVGLAGMGRLRETRRYADDMLDMGIHLHSATMDKLKTAFYKKKNRDAFKDSYDHIARRMKWHLASLLSPLQSHFLGCELLQEDRSVSPRGIRYQLQVVGRPAKDDAPTRGRRQA